MTVAAPLFDPINELTGAVPTWRLDEEPIYLEVVRDLGVPGQLVGPAGPVLVGVVEAAAAVDAQIVASTPTGPIGLVPTGELPQVAPSGRPRAGGQRQQPRRRGRKARAS